MGKDYKKQIIQKLVLGGGNIMLKVLIADDEKKICRLIQMLVNWDELDMQLVGVANNGIDALRMVN